MFDFAVVAASLLPQVGAFAMVARLARLLRVTRMVSAFPELRLIVGTMIRSIPSMGHVIVLLSLLLYMYAVLGFHFFREADPARWGSLGRRSVDVVPDTHARRLGGDPKRGIGAYPLAWVYFSSFVLVGVFVVVNLFIAVVLNNLESVKHEQHVHMDGEGGHRSLHEAIETMREKLDELEARLRAAPSDK